MIADSSVYQAAGAVAALVKPSDVRPLASGKMTVGSSAVVTRFSISWAEQAGVLPELLRKACVCAVVATAWNDCWSANWRSCAVMNASSPPKLLSAFGPPTLLKAPWPVPASFSALSRSAP